ncbi:ABC transporter permease subunit [Thomasclavelia saccharogumia]|uniref:ABC transporter permease subunit n=1 Tax=Thomasclavelia saccharogumia TaxID=341225 RepID=UPI00047A0575|nr:ABC transporter permease subunit [Thomasclavelia saccharogumia]
MSKPLFKAEIRANYKLLILFIAVITLYASIIITMFDPELGTGINALAESMPEYFALFGMQNPGVTLLDFIINYLYGFILLIIPFIYIIIMCFKLVAKYIDKGSMSYLLNTNYSRKEIIMTQASVLLFGVLILVLYAALLIIFCSHFMFKGELDISKFIILNIGLLFLEFFLAALCFMFACLFNEIKYSIGMGAGLGLIFFLVQMLSQVSDDISFLKYFTPLSLFTPNQIVDYDVVAFLNIGILGALAIIFFITALQGFKYKDLSL